VSQREIARRIGVDRKTVRRYVREANSPTPATGFDGDMGQTPPPRPPGFEELPVPEGATEHGVAASRSHVQSACEVHRGWIEAQLSLGRNAMSLYQDLVEMHGFAHGYNSVKRFVAKLRVREPHRFDVLEFLPGEEAQVDFGQGAPTLQPNGRYRRPWLFVMTLKYSGKRYRTTMATHGCRTPNCPALARWTTGWRFFGWRNGASQLVRLWLPSSGASGEDDRAAAPAAVPRLPHPSVAQDRPMPSPDSRVKTTQSPARALWIPEGSSPAAFRR
jgi:hypothetical protein